MDFTYPPQAEAFRAEFRAWIDEHLTDELRDLAAQGMGGTADHLEELRAWNRTLADAGYAAIAWPVEFGGRGAGLMEQVVFAEEMSRAGAPGTLNPIGIPNIAPSIMAWGTEEQKRTALPPMLRGDHIWCQGFSEPDAGSDLASVRMTARLDGDEFVVNGQKIWNTLGHVADWCELLVRTDAEAPKHKGISCLLVDMKLPGIEVRPLVNMARGEDFNEIFFDDVRVPASALLGPLDQGWKVAMTTLTNERAGVVSLHLNVRRQVADLLELARTTTIGDGRAVDDPVMRQRLAKVYIEGEYLKLLSDRAISAQLHGRQSGAEASVGKLVWSAALNHVAETAGELLGPDANEGRWGRDRVTVRSMSIAGGTTEINKNIVAQHVLGLPRSY
jgi:alkylation response protein AidB-like acyl-CoA dehydrogenase